MAGPNSFKSTLVRRALHRLVAAFQSARRLVWFFTGPATTGVHALALTPERQLVLVRLSYARGWRLPGGGLGHGETPERGILRELGEEIGLTGHGTVERVCEFEHRPDHRNDRSSLFIVRDVAYRPRWSLEVKAVRAFPLDRLPPDLADITRRLIDTAWSQL